MGSNGLGLEEDSDVENVLTEDSVDASTDQR